MLQARDFQHDPAVIEAKARRIIALLRKYHALGQPSKSKPKPMVDVAKAHRIGVYTAYKARAFATAYSKRELEALCRLRRPDGLPLSWAYVPYLLTVKDRARSELPRTGRQARMDSPRALRRDSLRGADNEKAGWRPASKGHKVQGQRA